MNTSSKILVCVLMLFLVGCEYAANEAFQGGDVSEIEFGEWRIGELEQDLEPVATSEIDQALVGRIVDAYAIAPDDIQYTEIRFLQGLKDRNTENTLLIFSVDHVSDLRVVVETDSKGRIVKYFLASTFQ